MRRIALETFHHLHALSLRFHLERQTGGLTRDIERGTRGISTLLSFMVFSVLPTLLEIALVTGFLIYKFDIWFGVITVGALILYVTLTFSISEWRTAHRRTMNEMDSKANTKAIDSLLNYETVKYFGNEGWEARRYDENLARYEKAVVTSETSLGLLNAAQAAVIAVAVSLLMWRAADGIVHGGLTLGDLVMVNAMLIQLYIPLNFLGVMYREMKQAFTDMEKMFKLMGENREVADKPGAPRARRARRRGALRERGLRLRRAPRDPEGRELRDPGGPSRGGGRCERLGQVHARAPAVPLLRREPRAHHHRRPGPARRHAGERARGDRHRAAGHRALQRHHPLQHRLRPAGRAARGDARRRRSGAHPRLHRGPARMRGRRRWASADSSSPAARSSACRSRARC